MVETETRILIDEDDMAKRNPNEQVVLTYITRLRDAGNDRAAFDRVVAGLQADRGVGVSEALAIAQRYVGKRLKTKKEVAAELVKKFVQTVRGGARLKEAEDTRLI